MKRLLLASIAIFVATPANATGGLVCSTAADRPIFIAMVISHTVVPSVVSARMTDNGREVPVISAQSWFDPQEIRIDLVDRNAMRHEARLRAGWSAAAKSYDGSIWRNGKRRWVRCRES